MAGIMDKLMNLMGIEEIEEDEQNEPEVSHVDGHAVDEGRKRKAALVSLPGGGRQVRVMVYEPRAFDEAHQIADHLKARRQVILNLEQTDKELGQRMLNFLSGCIYALDGTISRVGTSIFLFAPANVEVARENEAPRDRQPTFFR